VVVDMPQIYSSDFREKILNALEKGASATSLSKLFSISRKTIYNWQERFRSTGSVEANRSGPKLMSGKIQDLVAFKKFVEEKPDRSSEEMANDWQNISSSAIRRYLKLIGFTNKKNLWLQKPLRDKTTRISKRFREKI
jgi:transposase